MAMLAETKYAKAMYRQQLHEDASSICIPKCTFCASQEKDEQIKLKWSYTKNDQDEDVKDAFKVDGLGFPGLPYTENRLRNLIPNLPIRESDVILTSFPKCGNHWVKYILAHIYENGNTEQVNSEFVDARMEFLEVVSGRFFMEGESEDSQMERWEKMTEPRVFSTHLRWNLLPAGVKNGKCKTIMVVRNPKDMLVSYFKFSSAVKPCTLFPRYNGTFDEFLEQQMHHPHMGAPYGSGSYFDFYRSWWEERANCQLHIVYYEDLKRNLKAEIKGIADFLHRPISEDVLNKITHACTFEQMKQQGAMTPIDGLLDTTQSNFMRKGQVGDWKNWFTTEQSQLVEHMCVNKLSSIGFQVKWA